MEICTTRVRVESSRETWELHPLGDTHIDDPDHAADALARRIEAIRDNPRALWAGVGDYGSLILPGDKRFGSGTHLKDEWLEHIGRLPDYYLDRCEEIFKPIADKCVGLIGGNHEATIGKNYHRGVVAELASRLGRPDLYLGDRGWSVIVFNNGTRRLTLRLYTYHGWSAGRLKGRKAIQGERELGARDADVFFLGHDHQPDADLWWTESCEHSSKSGYYLRQRPRAVVNGGSWCYGQKPPTPDRDKKAWRPADMPKQSWAAGKNFRPQPPSNPYLLLHIDHGAHGPAGIDMEISWRGDRFYMGDAA